ncbi:MAG: dihydroorotase [Pseudomonadota bacterium]
MQSNLEIICPDDFHLHLRDGQLLKQVLGSTTHQFARAIIMPNLAKPVMTLADALAYRQRIIDCFTPQTRFQPLMTFFMSKLIDLKDLEQAFLKNIIYGVKLYPHNVTTNSDYGVQDLKDIDHILQAMSDLGIPLLIHGEVHDETCDIFDREAQFIERHLWDLRERFSNLKIVLEHITTIESLDFIKQAGALTAATVTPHHLLLNRSDIFKGGIRPHFYCLPIAKRERHRQALVEAVLSGRQDLFLGTDSAPHLQSEKQSICGCAGIFCAPTTLAILAELFDQYQKLDHLESFTSINGAKFYGLPLNSDKLVLARQAWKVDDAMEFFDGNDGILNRIVIFKGGETLKWKIIGKK